MSGPAEEPLTVRRRRRAVGPSASPGPRPGSTGHEPGLLAVLSSDEPGWGEVHGGTHGGSVSDDDERLRREVPPHHGS